MFASYFSEASHSALSIYLFLLGQKLINSDTEQKYEISYVVMYVT